MLCVVPTNIYYYNSNEFSVAVKNSTNVPQNFIAKLLDIAEKNRPTMYTKSCWIHVFNSEPNEKSDNQQ